MPHTSGNSHGLRNKSPETYRCHQRRYTKRHHHFQCFFGFTVVILLAACAALLLFVLYTYGKTGDLFGVTAGTADALKSDQCESTCMTSDCVQAAAKILSKLKPTIDPCEDFYEFSCGNYFDSQVVPEDNVKDSEFERMFNDILIVLKNKLETPITANDTELIKKAKIFYESCINTVDGDNIAETLRQNFRELQFDWPLLDEKWDATTFDLEKLVVFMNVIRIPVFFRLTPYKLSDNFFSIDVYPEGPFLIPLRYSSNETSHQEYLIEYNKVLREIFTLLGLSKERREAEINSLIEFETRFATIFNEYGRIYFEETTSTPDYDEPSTTNLPSMKSFLPGMSLKEFGMRTVLFGSEEEDDEIRTKTIPEMQEIFPAIDWTKFIRAYIQEVDFSVNHSNITVRLNHVMDEFLEHINTLIKETPPRLLSNYIHLRLLLDNMEYSTPTMERIFWENDLIFHRRVDKRQFLVRWKKCANLVRNHLTYSATALYVDEKQIEKIKVEMKNLVSIITRLVSETVSEAKLLSESLKEKILTNMKTMEAYIGYPKTFIESEQVAQRFKKMEFSNDSSFVNSIRLDKDSYKEMHRIRIEGTEDTEISAFNPLDVNAYYNPYKNKIIMPVGFLRYPLQYLNLPRYLWYGTMGIILGHEITHGVSIFKPENNSDIEFSVELLKEGLMTCIQDQYSAYPIGSTGNYVNGNITVAENFADNGALHLAFKAYEEYQATQKEKLYLPSLNYDDKQVFFIVYGQIWCEVVNEAGYMRYLRSTHSPGKYRTMVPLINSKEFLEAFKCPEGSPMNPVEKCPAWVS